MQGGERMKYFKKMVFLFIFLSAQCAYAQWAATVSASLNNVQRDALAHRRAIVVEKNLPLNATQLLISWNILRPSQGYFTLYTQTFDNAHHTWSDWIKMARWGAQNQQTFFYKGEGKQPSFHHVRLHAATGSPIAKCRVKIEAHDGASLQAVFRVSICAINLSAFKPELGAGKKFAFASTQIDNVPRVSQMALKHVDRTCICSPVSMSMVVSYLTGIQESPYDFADSVFDDGLNGYGSWPFTVAHAFDRCHGSHYFAVVRLNSFAELYRFLAKKLPVVVSVRGPMRSMPRGHTYADGHLMVVTGWDSEHKRVLCHDPAFDNNYDVAHSYPINDFLAAWERSMRLAYVIEPRI